MSLGLPNLQDICIDDCDGLPNVLNKLRQITGLLSCKAACAKTSTKGGGHGADNLPKPVHAQKSG